MTKSEIEQRLLSGSPLTWLDPNDHPQEIVLTDPRARRLFAFLLASNVRAPTGLSQDYIEALHTAYSATDDPAESIAGLTDTQKNGPWRLQSIETAELGGLNTFGGPLFQLLLEGESLLLEGANGSGKSSLTGAIIWALSGERPRDQFDGDANESKPVFGENNTVSGEWPPIACYPTSTEQLSFTPSVRSLLTFSNKSDETATVERTLINGELELKVSANFDVPSILIETGVLMPARLATIRFDDGRGRLTDAVQKLTGLDDLVSIGVLVNGLCHKSREYLAYQRKELRTENEKFELGLENARKYLLSVDVAIPEFQPQDTDDSDGELASLGKMLTSTAAELTTVISQDLSETLDLTAPSTQHSVIAAIGSAKSDLENGLDGLSFWGQLSSISHALDKTTKKEIVNAVEIAESKGLEAIQLLAKSTQDAKFQLKALASQYHEKHESGAIEQCPICEKDFGAESSIREELEELRSAGDAAARTFQDNLNNIVTNLKTCIPAVIGNLSHDILTWDPTEKLSGEIRDKYASSSRYAETLTTFSSIVDLALACAPALALPTVEVQQDESDLSTLNSEIRIVRRALELGNWFLISRDEWSSWWAKLVVDAPQSGNPESPEEQTDMDDGDSPECLSVHLERLSDALEKAEPYRSAAAEMRKSWAAGLVAAKIQKEISKRQAIANQLAPLKAIGNFAEAMARETIAGLSDRISAHLEKTLLTEQLQFQRTRLERKQGLVVRAGFIDGIQIDATLVANTSWLRAVLWAFLFALRERAVEQLECDQMPVVIFDDPQSTFDLAHQHRWAQYVSSLQNSKDRVQVILTTHDETFLDLIKVSGVTGRQAMIASPSADIRHAAIFEGESLDRCWALTKATNTNSAGRDYIVKVREHVEGLLRLLLRGQDANVLSVVNGFVVGKSREKLNQLFKSGPAPWDQGEFKTLVGQLKKDLPSIKHMEISHHAGGSNLGMAEACDVEKHWRTKLQPALTIAFGLARQHHLLHGGLTALHMPHPIVELPEGNKNEVQGIPLCVHGRASALSNGRIADGLLDVDDYESAEYKKIVLAQHVAYRLTANTLEPVARYGDIILVKQAGDPTPKSLVVAVSSNRLLARRLEFAANHSDVAVLSAQSINPRQIASPEIAHKATFKLHKIVGVIYDRDAWDVPAQQDMEVISCGSDSVLTGLTTDSLGLIRVEGQSAEPCALHGQCLIVRAEITSEEAILKLAGCPVIAADSEDNRYFKRMHFPNSDQVVLESLDSGGDYAPIVLSMPGKGPNCLTRIWPVAGVLFELPGQ